MDPEMVVTIARSLERLMITAGGILALLYGFRLFLARIVNRQEASLETKDFSLKLSRVGPGVFFAILGTVILVYAVCSTLTLNPASTTKDGSKDSIHYFGSNNQTALNRCQAINTTRQVLDKNIQAAAPDSSDRNNLVGAKELLSGIQDEIIANIFGPEKLKWAKLNIKTYSENNDRFSEEDQKKMAEIQPWLSGRIGD
jgi:hypothetical protein